MARLFKSPKEKGLGNVLIKIGNNIISQVTETKFLGVILDEKLNWQQHIHLVCKKISKGLGTINKLKRWFNSTTLLMYILFLYIPLFNLWYRMGFCNVNSDEVSLYVAKKNIKKYCFNSKN